MGHAVYDRFVEEAAEHCEVICLDLPGFGDCPEPAVPGAIEDTADLLAAAITELRMGPLTPVGHSMGAQVVAELAARHPHLVTHAVLIAPTVNRHERTVAKQSLRMLQDSTNNSPLVAMKSLTAYARTGPGWFAKKLGPTISHRIEDCLPKITAPTLVLRGENDRMVPRSWAREVTDLLQQGTLQEIADRGHEALISSGEPVARLILNWLQETPANS